MRSSNPMCEQATKRNGSQDLSSYLCIFGSHQHYSQWPNVETTWVQQQLNPETQCGEHRQNYFWHQKCGSGGGGSFHINSQLSSPLDTSWVCHHLILFRHALRFRHALKSHFCKKPWFLSWTHKVIKVEWRLPISAFACVCTLEGSEISGCP